MDSKLLGRYGESLAADFLRKKGYDILGAGYRGPFGEIDIIAMKDGTVSFVEVKTRQDGAYLPASTAVGKDKRRRIMLTAQKWVDGHGFRGQISFDIIEIYVKSRQIRHIKNAFSEF